MASKNNGSVIRTLKVYYKIFYREDSQAVYFPEIRLMGKWLADCGFQPGQHIEVLQEENKLTITAAWFEDMDDIAC